MAEFNDVSRDVRSMHIVLKAIEDYWTENDKLSSIQRQDLAVLAEACNETLQELAELLEKHKSLGSQWKRPIDRMKWAAKGIAPIRDNLLKNTVYLSAFNTTITK